MLSVVPVTGENIVELRAEGSSPSLLQKLVNTWIEVYLKAYDDSQLSTSNSDTQNLNLQQQALKKKIEEKSLELNQFRDKHDIVSLERDENRVLARLKGLNTSLDKAIDERAANESYLAGLRESMARGEIIMRPQDQASLMNLEQRAVEIREQLTEVQQRFTPEYMVLDKGVKAMQERLKLIEIRIKNKRKENQQAALSEAELAVSKSREIVSKLKRELTEYKKTASEFSTRLSEYQSKRQELEQLENMYRDTQDRLVQNQVGNSERLPKVRILGQASLPNSPISPDYLRDSIISIGAALILALFSIWILEFLTRSPAENIPGQRPAPFIYGIHSRLIDNNEQTGTLPQPVERPALDQPHSRELSQDETLTLLKHTNGTMRELACIFLSGLSPNQAANLYWKDVNLEEGKIQINSNHNIPLVGILRKQWLARPGNQYNPETPVWANAQGLPPAAAELNAQIRAIASNAGLSDPEEIDGSALRHTYLAYLVRQGLDLNDLERIAGAMSGQERETYRVLSPPGVKLPLDKVNNVYPAVEELYSSTNEQL
jgi:integrase